MEVLSPLILIMVLVTSVWVLSDARSTGVKKGQVKASFLRPDMGPWSWFVACLLLWLIAFPLYLSMRGEYRRINAKMAYPTTLTPQPARQGSNAGFGTCPRCGGAYPIGIAFCSRCGHSLADSGITPESTSNASSRAINRRWWWSRRSSIQKTGIVVVGVLVIAGAIAGGVAAEEHYSLTESETLYLQSLEPILTDFQESREAVAAATTAFRREGIMEGAPGSEQLSESIDQAGNAAMQFAFSLSLHKALGFPAKLEALTPPARFTEAHAYLLKAINESGKLDSIPLADFTAAWEMAEQDYVKGLELLSAAAPGRYQIATDTAALSDSGE